ncbi:MAG: TRAFs-binding domain-containing protein [Rubrivivax sp.]
MTAADGNRPLCFVLMPFGRKPDGQGGDIDCDAVYEQVLRPAIEGAGLEPLRADEEKTGGVIHKPMFERLILCEFALADLSSANANVFYELGLRHAVRRSSTVLSFARHTRLPFDVSNLRGLAYALGADGRPADAAADAARLAALLRTVREQRGDDSPLYQLVADYPQVQHEKTDVFRQRVDYSRQAKERLAAACRRGVQALRAEQAALGPLADVEAGVLVDLYLSYRDVQAWTEMIDLAAAMPRHLADTVLVREQLALALNRAGRGEDAERVLLALIEQRGPSSETCGILGRVYKDRWEAAQNAGDTRAARGLLDKAIAAHVQGFESDWRDAYPGVNAVTLMTLRQPPDPRLGELVPVVRYAALRRVARGQPDYWDHATLIELAVIARDEQAAAPSVAHALARVRAPWEPGSTARNLRLIREARAARGQHDAWALAIEQALAARAGEAPATPEGRPRRASRKAARPPGRSRRRSGRPTARRPRCAPAA